MSEEQKPSLSVQSNVIQITSERKEQSFRETLSRERASLKRSSHTGEHFWIASYPFFETSLCVTPALKIVSDNELQSINQTCRSEIDIYDCDGDHVNSLSLQFPDSEVGLIEMDPFLGACKLESGLKHAHIVVRSQAPGVSHQCRLVSNDHATIVGPTFSIFPVMPTFFPVTFEDSKSHLVVIVNYGAEPAAVRCRLFFGSRTPEIVVNIPGNGSRVLGIEGEFADCSSKAQDRSIQAYVRLTTRSDQGLGCQLIERSDGVKETNLFYSLA